MKERTKFVLEWEELWEEQEGYVNVAALCRKYGVSRQCGYKWIRRFVEGRRDIRALDEQSRRPRSSPHQTDDRIVDMIIRARKSHPSWGAVTLRYWLEAKHPGMQWPSERTIGNILRRHGMTRPRRRRQKISPHTNPLVHCDGANVVWSADFKGQFRVGDGRVIYPLTIFDNHSRFLLRCEGLEHPNGKNTISVFESAFAEYGLPGSIRTDNGPPFASKAPGALTELGVWLHELGVAHERIEPGHPEQNGRIERMHRTLKSETCSPPRTTLRAQQRAFDQFRRVYNDERPHRALGGRPPANVYERSARLVPKKIPAVDYPFAEELRQADNQGRIRWRNRNVHVGPALKYKLIALEPEPGDRWAVYFGQVLLGYLDAKRPAKELTRPRKRWKKL